MGVDYDAKAAIGCKILKDKLYVKRQIRGCDHPFIASDAKFCPWCGKPALINIVQPIDKYDTDKETLNGFPVLYGTNGEDIVVCVKGCYVRTDYQNESSHRVQLNTTTLQGDIKELREMLDSLGMWDESLFGLWVVLYCS